tara:strand:- start:4991 stop:6343 length:1353 start_codon:yes stop_codon:yes gene_type:complete
MSKLKTSDRLFIIGGGPAGLSAGYFAKKCGLNVSIHEKSGAIGGNCRTIIDGGFRYDTGAHRLHDKIDRVTMEIKSLLGSDLKRVSAPSKIHFNSKMIDFPLRFPNIFFQLKSSLIVKIIIENIINRLKPKVDINSFKDFAYQKYGKTLSELFLISYTEKLWGENTEKLDPVISGGRFKHLDIRTLINSFINNSKNKPKHLEGEFYYPRLGFGSIFDSIGEYIGSENIHLNSSVQSINHEQNKVKSVVLENGNVIKVGNLISTMPINILAKALKPKPPNEILTFLESIRFRKIKLCILYLSINQFTENASIYFPDISCPFNRIYEPKNRSADMAPDGQTSIVIEIPMGKNNINVDIGDEQLYEEIVFYLQCKKLLKKETIIKYKMVEIPFAYPVILKDNDIKIKKSISYFSAFRNMDIVGRNATFEYLHTHDLFDRSEKLIKKIKIKLSP